MLRIRLRRTGKGHQPSYRVVIADQRAKRDGDFVEIVGHYNPRMHPKVFVINQERVQHWLSVGAQPSETVHRLFADHGVAIAAPAKHATKPSKAEREAAAAAEAARQCRHRGGRCCSRSRRGSRSRGSSGGRRKRRRARRRVTTS
ncbi:MAG: 30S ribosomal protein S16 [Dehalococcoidia bacterium]